MPAFRGLSQVYLRVQARARARWGRLCSVRDLVIMEMICAAAVLHAGRSKDSGEHGDDDQADDCANGRGDDDKFALGVLF